MPHSALLGWDPDDRAKLLASLLEERARCQMCGTAPWEWEEDHFAYEAVVHACRGCLITDAAREDLGDAPAGTRVVLVPKERAAQLRAAPKRRPRRREG